MAENHSTRAINSDRLNRATLRLSGARALIATLGVLVSESSEIEVTGNLMGEALQGISYLLEDVDAELMATDAAAPAKP